jgi:hypothetical protein
LRIRKLFHSRTFWITLVVLVLWAFSEGAAGWQYHAFRDDWFALGRAATWRENSRWAFYLNNRLNAYRPLSFLVIIEVWSRFWPHITIVAAAIVSLMIWSALLWRRVLSQIFSAPFWAFVIVMLWLPLTDEGQYWITAANGIVLGLWFLGWAGLFLLRYAQRGKISWWIFATAAFLAADLCYEQYWFSVFVLTGALIWRFRKHWAGVLASPVLALTLTAGWYLDHTAGMAHNGKVSNHTLAGIVHSAHLIFPQVGAIWGPEMLAAWSESLRWVYTPWIWLVCIVLLSAVLAALILSIYAKSILETEPRPRSLPVILAASGVLWVAASYLLWLMTHYDWVADRSVTVAAPGVGLVVEGMFLWLVSVRSRLVMSLSAVAMAILTAAMVNLRGQDIRAYVAANSFSAQVGHVVVHALNDHGLPNANLTVLDPTEDFAPWTYAYHDHISTSWDSDWALQDMLEDMAPGTIHYHVQILWPGDPIVKANNHGNTAVVLTTRFPTEKMIVNLGLHHGLVVQYEDQWPRPEILRVRWFQN